MTRRGSVGVLNLFAIPLYVRFLGVESYGLIGFLTALQAVFVILDMGLRTTVIREMARYSNSPQSAEKTANLLKTMERIYVSLGFAISLLVIALAPLISKKWITDESLSMDTIHHTVILVGILIAVTWPSGLYSGGLQGLQRQVLLGSINVIVAFFKVSLTIFVLWSVSRSIEAFYIAQITGALIFTLCTRIAVWKALARKSRNAKFDLPLLRHSWKFAAGSFAISLTAIGLTQLDKVLLGRLLSLKELGYYMLGFSLSTTLVALIEPVHSAVYPRMTELVSENDSESLRDIYHQASQFMSVLLFPIAAIISFFARDVLFLWTQNPEVATFAAIPLSFLIWGRALNGLMHIPAAMQLSHAWTSLTFKSNLVALVLLVPALVMLTKAYGTAGAAAVWLILNMGYVIFTVFIMHFRILPKERWTWYGQDVAIPLFTSLGIAALGRFMMPEGLSPFPLIAYLGGLSILTALTTFLCTTYPRKWAIGVMRGNHPLDHIIK